MGLSNEERYCKVFNGLRIFKVRLTAFKNFCIREADNKETAKLIDKWSEQVDTIAGLISRQLDFSSTYWLLGNSEDSFQSLYSDSSGLGYQDRLEGVTKEFSVYYYKENENIVEFARTLTSSTEKWQRDEVITLAHWWHCYNISSFIYYGMFRYNDDCFSKDVMDRVTTLFGEMILRRFAMTSHNLDGTEDSSTQFNYEQVLLTKFKVFRDMLDKYGCKKDPKTGYYQPEKGFDKFKTEIQIDEIYNKVKEMSLCEVVEYCKQMESEKYEQREKYNEAEDKKKAENGKVDGLVGKAPPRTEKELEEILYKSTDYAECQQAAKDREIYYSTWGGWEHRFKDGKCIDIPKKKKKVSNAKIERV